MSVMDFNHRHMNLGHTMRFALDFKVFASKMMPDKKDRRRARSDQSDDRNDGFIGQG